MIILIIIMLLLLKDKYLLNNADKKAIQPMEIDNS